MLEPIDEELNLKAKFGGGLDRKENIETDGTLNQTELEKASSTLETKERLEGSMEKDDAYNKILSKVKSSTAIAHNDVSDDAKLANNKLDYESKITHLVQLAETKGVAHAVKVAQHLEDNYLLDELHDRLLADDLYNALVKKGLITEL